MIKAYYIPNGPKNLSSLFPAIDFNNIAEYYLELIDEDDTVIATTTHNQVCGCEDDEDVVRIHFLNYLGTIDAINFKRVLNEHETKSSTIQQPLSFPLSKTQHAVKRFNVKSNDTFRAITIDYGEKEMDWLDELFDSPLAWIQWDGGQGQPASFLPIIITDQKNLKQKVDDRFVYQMEIEFRLSHEKFIIRN